MIFLFSLMEKIFNNETPNKHISTKKMAEIEEKKAVCINSIF